MKGESFFMSRHKVELTGVNTANIEVLSSEEMTKLLKEYKKGNTGRKTGWRRRRLVYGKS
jgi:ribosomal protein S6E (S10)